MNTDSKGQDTLGQPPALVVASKGKSSHAMVFASKGKSNQFRSTEESPEAASNLLTFRMLFGDESGKPDKKKDFLGFNNDCELRRSCKLIRNRIADEIRKMEQQIMKTKLELKRKPSWPENQSKKIKLEAELPEPNSYHTDSSKRTVEPTFAPLVETQVINDSKARRSSRKSNLSAAESVAVSSTIKKNKKEYLKSMNNVEGTCLSNSSQKGVQMVAPSLKTTALYNPAISQDVNCSQPGESFVGFTEDSPLRTSCRLKLEKITAELDKKDDFLGFPVDHPLRQRCIATLSKLQADLVCTNNRFVGFSSNGSLRKIVHDKYKTVTIELAKLIRTIKNKRNSSLKKAVAAVLNVVTDSTGSNQDEQETGKGNLLGVNEDLRGASGISKLGSKFTPIHGVSFAQAATCGKKQVKVLHPNEEANIEKVREGPRIKSVRFCGGPGQTLPISKFLPSQYPWNQDYEEPNSPPSSLEHTPTNEVLLDLSSNLEFKPNDQNLEAEEEMLLGRQSGTSGPSNNPISPKPSLIKAIVPFTSDEITQHGFPVISTEPFPPKPLCFLCGSAGNSQLIFCSKCCEPYHPFCAGDDALMASFVFLVRPDEDTKTSGTGKRPESKKHDNDENVEDEEDDLEDPVHEQTLNKIRERFISWTCSRCLICTTCGQNRRDTSVKPSKINDKNSNPNKFTKCSNCRDAFHLTCLGKRYDIGLVEDFDGPPVDMDDVVEPEWMCEKCAKCRSCGLKLELEGQGDGNINHVGSSKKKKKMNRQAYKLMLCLECFRRRQKGSFCPVCNVSYDDDDYETRMMECGQCSRWIHGRCEGISEEQYQVLSALPECVEYVCKLCDDTGFPLWLQAVQMEIINGCESALRVFTQKALTDTRKRRALNFTQISLNSISEEMETGNVVESNNNGAVPSANAEKEHPYYRNCFEIEVLPKRTRYQTKRDDSSHQTDVESSEKETQVPTLTIGHNLGSAVAETFAPCSGSDRPVEPTTVLTEKTEQSGSTNRPVEAKTLSEKSVATAELSKQVVSCCKPGPVLHSPSLKRITRRSQRKLNSLATEFIEAADGAFIPVLDVSVVLHDIMKHPPKDVKKYLADLPGEHQQTGHSNKVDAECNQESETESFGDQNDCVVELVEPTASPVSGNHVSAHRDPKIEHEKVSSPESMSVVTTEITKERISMDDCNRKVTEHTSKNEPLHSDESIQSKEPVKTTPHQPQPPTPSKKVVGFTELVKKNVDVDTSPSVTYFQEESLILLDEFFQGDADRKKKLREDFIQAIREVFTWFDDDLMRDSDLPKFDHSTFKRRKNLRDEQAALLKANAFENIFWSEERTEDKRVCSFCQQMGDENPEDSGRLLWAGVNEWVHVNCALWSSEIFEEESGALQQMGQALFRSRNLSCSLCSKFGASVSCCHSSCRNSYHFPCAQKAGCSLKLDKTVFCPEHGKKVDPYKLQSEFQVFRKVFVSLDWIKKKENSNYKSGIASSLLHIFVGSLKIDALGEIVPISVVEDAAEETTSSLRGRTLLQSTDYKCTRLFWSHLDPEKKCTYEISGSVKQDWFRNYVQNSLKDGDTCLQEFNLVLDHEAPQEEFRSKLLQLKSFHGWINHAPKLMDEYNVEWIPKFPLVFEEEHAKVRTSPDMVDLDSSDQMEIDLSEATTRRVNSQAEKLRSWLLGEGNSHSKLEHKEVYRALQELFQKHGGSSANTEDFEPLTFSEYIELLQTLKNLNQWLECDPLSVQQLKEEKNAYLREGIRNDGLIPVNNNDFISKENFFIKPEPSAIRELEEQDENDGWFEFGDDENQFLESNDETFRKEFAAVDTIKSRPGNLRKLCLNQRVVKKEQNKDQKGTIERGVEEQESQEKSRKLERLKKSLYYCTLDGAANDSSSDSSSSFRDSSVSAEEEEESEDTDFVESKVSPDRRLTRTQSKDHHFGLLTRGKITSSKSTAAPSSTGPVKRNLRKRDCKEPETPKNKEAPICKKCEKSFPSNQSMLQHGRWCKGNIAKNSQPKQVVASAENSPADGSADPLVLKRRGRPPKKKTIGVVDHSKDCNDQAASSKSRAVIKIKEKQDGDDEVEEKMPEEERAKSCHKCHLVYKTVESLMKHLSSGLCVSSSGDDSEEEADTQPDPIPFASVSPAQAAEVVVLSSIRPSNMTESFIGEETQTEVPVTMPGNSFEVSEVNVNNEEEDEDLSDEHSIGSSSTVFSDDETLPVSNWREQILSQTSTFVINNKNTSEVVGTNTELCRNVEERKALYTVGAKEVTVEREDGKRAIHRDEEESVSPPSNNPVVTIRPQEQINLKTSFNENSSCSDAVPNSFKQDNTQCNMLENSNASIISPDDIHQEDPLRVQYVRASLTGNNITSSLTTKSSLPSLPTLVNPKNTLPLIKGDQVRSFESCATSSFQSCVNIASPESSSAGLNAVSLMESSRVSYTRGTKIGESVHCGENHSQNVPRSEAFQSHTPASPHQNAFTISLAHEYLQQTQATLPPMASNDNAASVVHENSAGFVGEQGQYGLNTAATDAIHLQRSQPGIACGSTHPAVGQPPYLASQTCPAEVSPHHVISFGDANSFNSVLPGGQHLQFPTQTVESQMLKPQVSMAGPAGCHNPVQLQTTPGLLDNAVLQNGTLASLNGNCYQSTAPQQPQGLDTNVNIHQQQVILNPELVPQLQQLQQQYLLQQQQQFAAAGMDLKPINDSEQQQPPLVFNFNNVGQLHDLTSMGRQQLNALGSHQPVGQPQLNANQQLISVEQMNSMGQFQQLNSQPHVQHFNNSTGQQLSQMVDSRQVTGMENSVNVSQGENSAPPQSMIQSQILHHHHNPLTQQVEHERQQAHPCMLQPKLTQQQQLVAQHQFQYLQQPQQTQPFQEQKSFPQGTLHHLPQQQPLISQHQFQPQHALVQQEPFLSHPQLEQQSPVQVQAPQQLLPQQLQHNLLPQQLRHHQLEHLPQQQQFIPQQELKLQPIRQYQQMVPQPPLTISQQQLLPMTGQQNIVQQLAPLQQSQLLPSQPGLATTYSQATVPIPIQHQNPLESSKHLGATNSPQRYEPTPAQLAPPGSVGQQQPDESQPVTYILIQQGNTVATVPITAAILQNLQNLGSLPMIAGQMLGQQAPPVAGQQQTSQPTINSSPLINAAALGQTGSANSTTNYNGTINMPSVTSGTTNSNNGLSVSHNGITYGSSHFSEAHAHHQIHAVASHSEQQASDINMNVKSDFFMQPEVSSQFRPTLNLMPGISRMNSNTTKSAPRPKSPRLYGTTGSYHGEILPKPMEISASSNSSPSKILLPSSPSKAEGMLHSRQHPTGFATPGIFQSSPLVYNTEPAHAKIPVPSPNIAVVRPMENPLQKMSNQVAQLGLAFNSCQHIAVSGSSSTPPCVPPPSLDPPLSCDAIPAERFEKSNIMEQDLSTLIPPPQSPSAVPAVKLVQDLIQLGNQPRGQPKGKSIKMTLKRKEGGNSYCVNDVKKSSMEATGAMRSLKIKGHIKSGEQAGMATDVVVTPLIQAFPDIREKAGLIDHEDQLGTPAKSGEANVALNSDPSPVANKRVTHRAMIVYEVKCNDTILFRSSDVRAVWCHVFEIVQGTRLKNKLPPLSYPATNISLGENQRDGATSMNMLGLTHQAVQFLLEQLPGSNSVIEKHKFKYHQPRILDSELDESLPSANSSGSARTEEFTRRKPFDMFGWLASKHRTIPTAIETSTDWARQDLPIAMRYRNLREKSNKTSLGVFYSAIHGRGLFTRRDIQEGEMIIEYAGELIRAILSDRREKYYESKGIGCYFFTIDEKVIIDATMKGNAARFINHSCEPNCKSKIVEIFGKKHILIFAERNVFAGEELTYDYKFALEDYDKKIPCTCGARKCRKYLN